MFTSEGRMKFNDSFITDGLVYPEGQDSMQPRETLVVGIWGRQQKAGGTL